MASARNITITTLSFVTAFCLTHFWPAPKNDDFQKPKSPQEALAFQQPTSSELEHLEIPPDERPLAPESDLLNEPNDDAEDAVELARGEAFRATDDGYRLAKVSPRKAAAWLETLEPGTYRDHAIGGFVRRTFKTDPQGGVDWAAVIDNLELRDRYLRVALRQLISVDFDTGEAATHEAELSQQALDSLLPQQR